ncbi:MAG: TIM barrel protein [Bacteroidetes bacterium]|jgi:sugar phosphate isomerase/epimerase|nr:TIM barrel protein [Bacteroidota bacterium]
MTNEEQIKTFAMIGFDGFFIGYESDEETLNCARIAKKYGMTFQSLHAPFTKCNYMWVEDNEKGESAINELLNCVEICKKAEIPIMIVHAFIGFEEHNPTNIGIERFGCVIDAAERGGIQIAFENTEGEEYLVALMDAFKDNKYVGFCWDSGHEMCYNRSKDMLSCFGGKLIATHLNDNLGIRDYDGRITWLDDLHLLPFDGIADWKYNVDRLKKCGFDSFLTLELTRASKPGRHENDIYAKMDPIDYLTEAYKRACRIAAMF